MVTDNRQPSSRFQDFCALHQEVFECLQFAVYFNADGLKNLAEIFVPRLGRCALRNGFAEFTCGSDWFGIAGAHHGSCQLAGIGDFAIPREDVYQTCFVIAVHYVVCTDLSRAVHPHIERCIEAVRETAGGFINLMRGDAEIGKDAIHR